MRLSMNRIVETRSDLDGVFRNTPLFECEPLGASLRAQILLKVEILNPVRCFKGRGTEAVLADLGREGRYKSTVCASAGNLGQALAYSSRSHGIPSMVVASSSAVRMKIDRIRALDAEVLLVDGDIEEAREVAREYAAEHHSYLVEDSLDINTCEGAASIGLELAEAGQPLDVVLIALGGGAMATGVGYVVKQRMPGTEVICVQPAGAPAMTLSWRSGKPVHTESFDTIADGVAGRYSIPEVLDDLLETADDCLLVEESSIIRGMQLLYEFAGLVVEPSAALGIAAVLENRERFAGRRVATIICGGNVMPGDFRRWVLEA